MRHRVVIAIALACGPDLLIVDEPTTALDVTVQAEIIELMRSLCAERGTAVLMISHDLGLVANVCRRVAVMYAGRIVEEPNSDDIFRASAHPYTLGLVESLPRLASRPALVRTRPRRLARPRLAVAARRRRRQSDAEARRVPRPRRRIRLRQVDGCTFDPRPAGADPRPHRAGRAGGDRPAIGRPQGAGPHRANGVS